MKKVLVITYYWPPSGGANVQRWLKFSRLLPQYGWQPTILTTLKGDYPKLDYTLLAKVPPELQVIRTKPLTFGKIFRLFAGKKASLPFGSFESKKSDSAGKKILLWIRKNLIIPDARLIWLPSCLNAAKKEILKGYDLVITSGPPHSTHLVGLYLQKKFGVKWLTDFRDPWSKMIYNKGRLALSQRLDEKLEAAVRERCNGLITVSDYWAKNLPSKNSVAIYNSFLEEDFAKFTYLPAKKFRIKYTGTLLKPEHMLDFIEALGSLCMQKDIYDIELSIIGEGEKIPEYIVNRYPALRVNRQGFLPHQEAVENMINAELLVLLVNKSEGMEGWLTMKVFEYLAAGTPIVGFGPETGETAALITQCRAGHIFWYDKKQELQDYIYTFYKRYKQNENIRNEEIPLFLSARKQTEKLATMMDLC